MKRVFFVTFLALFLSALLGQDLLHADSPKPIKKKQAAPVFTTRVNLHLIDSAPNGFSIYRAGIPTRQDIKGWCKLGISEVMVLSGDAKHYELKHKKACPSLKVIYNIAQNVRIPASKTFLQFFDKWVVDARKSGKKILFRCLCGCHRTGRLAAYYEMKYLGRRPSDAISHLFRYGKHMSSHLFLPAQIFALSDYVKQVPCRYKGPQAPRNCPVEKGWTPERKKNLPSKK